MSIKENKGEKPKNINVILSQKNQEILQTDNKYSFYLSYKSKINSNLTWRCVNYKQINNRCQAKIITNEKHEIVNWESEHNHLSDRIEFNKMILKNNINQELKSLPNKYIAKAKDIYNNALSKSNSKLNLSFDSVKYGIYKKIHADEPPIAKEVKDIPNDYEAFTTKDNKKYLVFKDNTLIILQSEKMLEILDSFSEEIFIDSTFKVVPEPFYQLLILRVFDPVHNSFHTVAFALMVNKSKFLYMKALTLCFIKKEYIVL